MSYCYWVCSITYVIRGLVSGGYAKSRVERHGSKPTPSRSQVIRSYALGSSTQELNWRETPATGGDQLLMACCRFAVMSDFLQKHSRTFLSRPSASRTTVWSSDVTRSPT